MVEEMEMLGRSERTMGSGSGDEGSFFFMVKIPTMLKGVGFPSRLQ